MNVFWHYDILLQHFSLFFTLFPPLWKVSNTSPSSIPPAPLFNCSCAHSHEGLMFLFPASRKKFSSYLLRKLFALPKTFLISPPLSLSLFLSLTHSLPLPLPRVVFSPLFFGVVARLMVGEGRVTTKNN